MRAVVEEAMEVEARQEDRGQRQYRRADVVEAMEVKAGKVMEARDRRPWK